MNYCFRLILLFIAASLMVSCSRGSETDSLQQIQDTGIIRLAFSENYPPYSFYNGEQQLTGFDVDVAREVASRLGVRFEPVLVEWMDIIDGLKNKEFDGILGNLSITRQRQKIVSFTQPYYYSGSRLLVHKGSSFTTPEDLQGKTIGLVRGTTFEQDARQLGAGDIIFYPNNMEMLRDLETKNIDGVIADSIFGYNVVHHGPFPVKTLGPLLRREKIAAAFRKKDHALCQAVDSILQDMQRDGTMNILIKKVAQGGYFQLAVGE